MLLLTPPDSLTTDIRALVKLDGGAEAGYLSGPEREPIASALPRLPNRLDYWIITLIIFIFLCFTVILSSYKFNDAPKIRYIKEGTPYKLENIITYEGKKMIHELRDRDNITWWSLNNHLIKNRDMKGLGLFNMFDKIEFCGHYWDEREGPLDLKELSVSLLYFILILYVYLLHFINILSVWACSLFL